MIVDETTLHQRPNNSVSLNIRSFAVFLSGIEGNDLYYFLFNFWVHVIGDGFIGYLLREPIIIDNNEYIILGFVFFWNNFW